MYVQCSYCLYTRSKSPQYLVARAKLVGSLYLLWQQGLTEEVDCGHLATKHVLRITIHTGPKVALVKHLYKQTAAYHNKCLILQSNGTAHCLGQVNRNVKTNTIKAVL